MITEVTPSIGSAAGGTVLTITGLGFDAEQMLDNDITVDSLPCKVTSATATQLKCVTEPVPKLDKQLDVGQRGCVGKSCQRLSGRGMEVRTLKTQDSGESLQSHVGDTHWRTDFYSEPVGLATFSKTLSKTALNSDVSLSQ